MSGTFADPASRPGRPHQLKDGARAVSGSTYWTKEIKRASARSPKEGATRRLDRLRSELRNVDPVIANRAWREVGDALQSITDRYAR